MLTAADHLRRTYGPIVCDAAGDVLVNPTPAGMSEREYHARFTRARTCVHEAGHCLVAVLLEVEQVSAYLFTAAGLVRGEMLFGTPKSLHRELALTYGARVAELRVFGDCLGYGADASIFRELLGRLPRSRRSAAAARAVSIAQRLIGGHIEALDEVSDLLFWHEHVDQAAITNAICRREARP